MKRFQTSGPASFGGQERDLDAGRESFTLIGDNDLAQSIDESTLDTIIEESSIGYVVIPSTPPQETEGIDSSA